MAEPMTYLGRPVRFVAPIKREGREVNVTFRHEPPPAAKEPRATAGRVAEEVARTLNPLASRRGRRGGGRRSR